MERHQNPLLAPRTNPAADVEDFAAPAVFARPRGDARRILRDQRRTENARAALDEFDRDVALYGFTKGQFSLIQLITAALEKIGPASLVISTWTAANQDVTEILAFLDAGTLTAARWLVDLTFTKRTPELAHRIRQTFGDDAIRVARNHAKFALLKNADWDVVIHTSMNLNHNPRFENFEIAHDPALYAFHAQIIDEIWHNQSRDVDRMRPYEIQKHFAQSL